MRRPCPGALRGIGALALLALGGAGVPALEGPAPSPAADAKMAHAERVERLAGLKNVGRLAPGIYRGSEPTFEGLRTLKAMGIRTVINLRHHHGKNEERACRALGLDYVRIALATTDEPRDEDVRRFLSVVTDRKRQPVYFHCMRGKDRTGAMAAVYRVVVERWSAENALTEMDAFGTFKAFRDLRRYVKKIAAEPARVWPVPPVQ
jgi:tyrosine-protein phosphatase SIW14